MRRHSLTRRGVILAAPAIIACTVLDHHARAQGMGDNTERWNGDIMQGEVLVRLKPGVAIDAILPLLARHNATLGRILDPVVPRTIQTFCSSGDEPGLEAELMASGLVEFVEPQPVMYHSALPNDSSATSGGPFDNYIQALNLDKVWDRFKVVNFTPSTILPIIDLDTGVQGTFSGGVFTPTHPDMDNSNLIAFYNASTTTQDVHDTAGHGTLVMGIMCALTNNATDVPSVGWGCGQGVVVKTVATASEVASTLPWLLANVPAPAFVTYPWTGHTTPTPQTLIDAFISYYNAGYLVFGASGDLGISTCESGTGDVPDPYAVTVTANGVGGPQFSNPSAPYVYRRANGYASYGPALGGGSGQGMKACAPGGNGSATPTNPVDTLDVLKLNGTWQSGEGTSLSVPVLAGITRLLSIVSPRGTPVQTIEYLRQVVTNQSLTIPCTGFSPYSMGCVDALACLNFIQSRTPVSFR